MRVARVVSGGAVVPAAVGETTARCFEHGLSVLDALGGAGAPTGREVSRAAVEFAVPVEGRPIVRDCVGFLDHVRNCRASRGVYDALGPAWQERPAFYFANGGSLRACTERVAVPPGCRAFDFELEVAAVLSHGGSNLSAAAARDCIGGYVLYCDWSARDIQADERSMQIGQGKGKDSAISLGPWIVTADEAAAYRRDDGLDIEVFVEVNGRRLMTGPFTGMDWSFEELVAYASLGAEVHPGDLVASGTVPGGCLLESSASPRFRGWLGPGDVVVLGGGPLGEIRVVVDPGPEELPRWRRIGVEA